MSVGAGTEAAPYHNPKSQYKDASGQWWYFWGGMRTNRVRVAQVVCKKCSGWFVQTIHRNECCGRTCGVIAAYRKSGKEFRRGEKARAWKGGRRKEHRGYMLAYAPDHPDVQGTKRIYVLEHRLVMEQMLGRFLEPHEQVHHKNGIRDDNRPENLELWVKQQPPGQRVHEYQSSDGYGHSGAINAFVVAELGLAA